jgi:hypothetical protein
MAVPTCRMASLERGLQAASGQRQGEEVAGAGASHPARGLSLEMRWINVRHYDADTLSQT